MIVTILSVNCMGIYQIYKFSFYRFFIIVLLVFSTVSVLFGEDFDEISKKDSIAQKDKLNNHSKEIKFGFSVIPGMAKLKTNEDFDFDFSLSLVTSFDVNIFLNKNVGLKTGLSFSNFKTVATVDFSYPSRTLIYSIWSIGLPMKFLLITKGNPGFYFESGFIFYFPVFSKLTSGYSITQIHEVIVPTGEIVIGVNLKYQEIMFNVGAFTNYSFTNYLTHESFSSKGIIVGLQLGIMFNKHK